MVIPIEKNSLDLNWEEQLDPDPKKIKRIHGPVKKFQREINNRSIFFSSRGDNDLKMIS